MFSVLDPTTVTLLIGCGLLAALLVVGLTSLVGIVVFGPLRKRVGRLQAPTQFQLSDFFWLVVQFQFALGYCVRYVGIEQLYYFILVFGFLMLATVGMWAGAMSFMTRAGVTQPLRRAVFILVLLPLTLALMIGDAFLFVIMPATMYIDYLTENGVLSVYLGTSDLLRWGVTNVVMLAAALVGATWVLRRLSLWILLDDASQQLASDGPAVDNAATDVTVAPPAGA